MNIYAARNIFVLAVVLMLTVGCSSPRYLMPAPNLYQGQTSDQVFGEAPEDWRQSHMRLFYATDRKPQENEDGSFGYGSGRSASLAFGTVIVDIDGNSSWEQFTALSLDRNRSKELKMDIDEIIETSRLPPTPHPASMVDGEIKINPDRLAEVDEIEARMNAQISQILAETPRKEVVLFIHGYNNSFADATYDLAEIWHFLGRRQLPVLYTWPAGHEGLRGIRGYNHDRESGEFTIYHLKQFLKSLGRMEEIEKIHIIAHSRGTDVLVSALREVFLEIRAAGKDPEKELRIANVILAAPDLDYEVVLQRVVAEFVEAGVGQATIYTSPADKAIKISEWLYGSIARIGHMESGVLKSSLTEKQFSAITENSSIQLIEFRGKTDKVGHGYFSSSSAVSSDLIALINAGAEAGSPERPLVREGAIYWVINDGYPFIDSTAN